MKYKLPQPSPDLTFRKQDTFQRKELAEMLTRVISKTTEPLVISLEAQWGDGKTSFVYKWINYLKDEESPEKRPTALYIDAYQSDFMSEPLLLLASEIYTFAEQKAGQSKAQYQFMKVVAKTSGAIAKGVTRGALHWATAGIFSGDQFDKLESGIADELANAGDKAIENAIKSYGERKQSLERLSQSLTDLAEEIDPDMPLIVIVDELDRCRPAFALELLEVIKHLFSAEKIVFVLVNNPHQMEESVRAQYGAGVDATSYLQKLYDLTLTLPKMEKKQMDVQHMERFVSKTVAHFDEDGDFASGNWATYIVELVARRSLSLRDIQKLISYIVLCGGHRAKLPEFSRGNDIISPALQVGLAYMAMKDRKLLKSIYHQVATSSEILSCLGLNVAPVVVSVEDQTADAMGKIWRELLGENDEPSQPHWVFSPIDELVREHGSQKLLSDMAKDFIQFNVS